MSKSKAQIFERGGYRVQVKANADAEITMYGEIVESRPVDWWTGEEVAGDFIIQSEFMADLEDALAKGVKNLTLRMNSAGGDAAVSILIHNRLREAQANGVKVTCIVDGVAMSGGSLIMCAADTVKVHPACLVMIHKCWGITIGAYNADELRKIADTQDAYDNAQCAIYARKTGLSDTKILHMMSETTYMTGEEAVEKGFADGLLEDAAPVKLAASANRGVIFAGGHAIRLMHGVTAPESLPVQEMVSTEHSEDINMSGSDTDEQNKGGGYTMATNLNELRAENPELAAQVESDVREALNAEREEAVRAAATNERNRLESIDEIASLYDDETVRDAKYGNPCSAQELAFRAAVAAAKNGTAFMAAAMNDTAASGVNEVTAVQAPQEEIGVKAEDPEADGKQAYAEYVKIKQGGKR